MSHSFVGELKDLIAELDLVDGVLVLPGVVLLDARKERLREEEAADPEAVWLAFLNPLLKNIQALFEVFNVAKKSLHAGVRLLLPLLWDRVVLDAGE